MSQRPLVILLDLNNALYRYFHTTPPRLFNEQRIETADAVLTYVKKLLAGRVIDVPDKVIAVADHNAPTFRHYLCCDYKAKREEMKPELARQEPLCHQAIEAYGVPVMCKAGVEADDTMGMLARYYEAKGCYVVMVTTDKDMHQLLTDNIHIFHPQTKILIDPKVNQEKFGVTTDQVADYLAMMGDGIDGIDGLHGIGKKTASKWLQKYGSMESLVRHKDEIKGVAGNTLRENYERLFLFKQLTTIQADPSFLTEKERRYLDTHARNEDKCNMINKLYGLRTLDSTTPAPDSMPPTPPLEAYMNDPQLM